MERVSRIEATLEHISKALGDSVYVDPPAPLDVMANPPPRNWDMLDQFAIAYSRSKEQGADAVLFAGYSDILARFGPPMIITDKNRWLYRRKDALAGQAKLVEFQFRGGYVIEARADLQE